MTEPAAYRYENEYGSSILSKEKPHPEWDFKNVEPLYTADQLHPHVKMTRAEFDEFCLLYKKLSNSTAIGVLNTVIYNESKEFKNLKSLIFKSRGDFFKMLSLFDDFDVDNPEKTIEIVPDMKWFVRSKTKENGHYQVMAESRVSDMPRYTIFKSYAMTFDTKEEAELWTNPLTEAVQLPVEGER